MARLPEVGGDDGNWGDILNDFLRTAHADDGTLAPNTVSGSTLQAESVTEAHLSTTVQAKLNATPEPVTEQAVPIDRQAGLVGWWQFEEQSGMIAVDASGFGNHGRMPASATRTAGRIGQAVQLAGSGSGIMTSSMLFNITRNVTIALWVRPSASGTQALIKKSANAQTDGYELTISSSGRPFFRCQQFSSGDTYRVDAPSSIPTNGSSWSHVAVTIADDSTVRLYVNGAQVATGAAPATGLPMNDLPLIIGAETSGDYALTGGVDDVRFYDTVLTPTKVAALYAA